MIILALIALITYIIRFVKQVRTLPPGPQPIPLLGNLPQMATAHVQGKSIVQLMQEWTEEYGPVFTVWLGPMASVNVCDYALAQEIMVKNGAVFADRQVPSIFNVVRNGKGVIVSNGDYWVEQRRFSLHTLRNFGVGRNFMEDRIMEEFQIHCELLDEKLRSSSRLVLDPHEVFDDIVTNTINRILFTKRFSQEQSVEFRKLKILVDELMEHTGIFDMIIADWSPKLPFVKKRIDNLVSPMLKVIEFLKKQVEERREDIACGRHELEGDGTDFVDAFLIQMEKRGDEKDTTFTEETLLMDLMDLWLAGQETTSSTLTWAFVYLLLNPQTLKKVREEVVSVTRRDRHLSLNDKQSTPYLNATILEVLRCSTIVPINLFRQATQDTVVGEYAIPKGTAVTAQIAVIMNDEKHFHNPNEFNPDRFLTSSGERIDHFVIPFGIGKRACLGESLARAELYLVLGNLVQRYDFSIDESNLPSMISPNEMGTLRRPKPYNIVVERFQ